jgi:uncharacterized membrane protein
MMRSIATPFVMFFIVVMAALPARFGFSRLPVMLLGKGTTMSIASHLHARPRLFIAVCLGALAFLGLTTAPATAELSGHTRAALAIDGGAIIFLGSTWHMMLRSTKERMLRRARLEDEGAQVILVLTGGGIVLSLVIIAMEMHGAKDLPPVSLALHTALAVTTILATWFVTHTLFALRYAHAYYMGHRGMDFHSEREPDYMDFLYQAATVAVTGATSDVEISSPLIRRITLAHCVVSFFLNMAVLGLTINIIAGLI